MRYAESERKRVVNNKRVVLTSCRDRKRVLLPFMLRDCKIRLFVWRKKKDRITDKIDLGENTTTCTDKVKNIKSGENLQT